MNVGDRSFRARGGAGTRVPAFRRTALPAAWLSRESNPHPSGHWVYVGDMQGVTPVEWERLESLYGDSLVQTRDLRREQRIHHLIPSARSAGLALALKLEPTGRVRASGIHRIRSNNLASNTSMLRVNEHLRYEWSADAWELRESLG